MISRCWLGLILLLACSRQGQSKATDGGASGTPVKVAVVVRATLQIVVTGPGHTDATEQQKVRSPFDGILLDLKVANGDHVAAGQVIGHVVSQNSQAALVGAQSLLKSARTPTERRDAARANELAEQGIIKTPLRVPEGGVVVAHSADEGSLVTTHEDIVSLAAADSIVFIATIGQNALPGIHAGQKAVIRLAAIKKPIDGVVHVVLSAATANDLTSPVRVDFAPDRAPTAIGLFGTVEIVVGEHRDARVVPESALLRDDVSGITRLATVGPDDKAHWVNVTPGIQQKHAIELVAPVLPAGTRVIVSGQIGLPEGAPVLVQ